MERDAPTEAELYQTLTNILFGYPSGVRETALGEAVLGAFAVVQTSDANRDGPTVSEMATSVIAWLLGNQDPFNSESIGATAALSRVRRELSQWPPRKQADMLDEFTRLLRRRHLQATEQQQTAEERWLEENKHLFAQVNQYADDHGYTAVPMIVRDAKERYVFAGTQIPAAHVIARVPAGDDRAALKARWPELRDEHINVAKMLGLAHAVGEGQASGEIDETIEEFFENLRDFDQIQGEIEAWRDLKDEIQRSPRYRRTGLLHLAKAQVRYEREALEMIDEWELDENGEGDFPGLAALMERAGQEPRTGQDDQSTPFGPSTRRYLDLVSLLDEQRRIREVDNRALLARYHELLARAADIDLMAEDDGPLRQINGRLAAVEDEQARRWRQENARKTL